MAIISFKRLFQITLPALFAAGFLLPALSVGVIDAWRAGFPELCVFHRVTGLDCPGCGMTRSLLCFFSMNWRLSFEYNPLGPVLGIGLCALWARSFFSAPLIPQAGLKWARRHALWILFGVVAWGVLRNF